MNIFILDEDPVLAAQMLCDRHVNKMILETAQMLSSVADKYGHPTLYKPAYKNHPCTLWAGKSKENWLWLIDHGLALRDEKIFRTGSGHKSASVIEWYKDLDYGPDKSLGLTSFAQAMPNFFKHDNAVIAYRSYYLGDKQFFKDGRRPKWKVRGQPSWWYYA